jgi:hypothetical protein
MPRVCHAYQRTLGIRVPGQYVFIYRGSETGRGTVTNVWFASQLQGEVWSRRQVCLIERLRVVYLSVPSSHAVRQAKIHKRSTKKQFKLVCRFTRVSLMIVSVSCRAKISTREILRSVRSPRLTLGDGSLTDIVLKTILEWRRGESLSPYFSGLRESCRSGGNLCATVISALNVVPTVVPSLRERADDLPLLVEYSIHFSEKTPARSSEQHPTHRRFALIE